jgi:hypothetical protein
MLSQTKCATFSPVACRPRFDYEELTALNVCASIVCCGSAVAATVAAMEAATDQIREEMHKIMNVEGKGGLRFGAMEALATADGQGKRLVAAEINSVNPRLLNSPRACNLTFATDLLVSTVLYPGQERGGWHAMIVDCDRKRDHTPVTCGVIDKVTDPDVGGVEIITCDSSVVVFVFVHVAMVRSNI